jgi:hypothetical protein
MPIDRSFNVETGRPNDPVARSWWDAGIRVEGYPQPPTRNFDCYIRALTNVPIVRRSHRRPWGSRFRVKGWL